VKTNAADLLRNEIKKKKAAREYFMMLANAPHVSLTVREGPKRSNG
jgi:inactivated superfamily I helicase